MDNLIKDIDLNLARKISLSEAKRLKILPVKEIEDKIYVVTSTEQEEGKDFLKFLFGKKIEYIKIKEDELQYIMDLILNFKEDTLEEDIFKDAIKNKASDIHFEPIKDIVNIRFRINGALILVRKIKFNEYLKITSRLKVKSNLDITEKRRPQDGKLFINFNDKIYNCRISTVPVVNGEKIVVRILYNDKYLSSLEELNFSKEQQEIINKIVRLKNGLIIVNGPTGSGKSTTLYSILNKIKNENINIETLEDPIEVCMDGLNQINLNEKIGITFESGLRSMLRQDPDVIMVGEIRDETTAKMAIRAAITGHKVYSTIHTKSPREVILRLEEMGCKRYLIKDALAGIISQRLIKILCKDCKKEIKESSKKKYKLYKKCGCSKCNNSGYTGRTLVSAVYYIGKNEKERIENIHEDINSLSNNQMIEILENLLEKGEIDYYDYLDFLEGEELNEEKL
ncbi:MAG: GspE/PulE family protein [Clostridium sp.]|nr:GspE/PulE family protein [Clostridium sp.]MCI7443841.1 GspE/PulE family protein [Clostridium sp.]